MAQKKSENQATERRSSRASDIEATIAEVEAALDEAGSEDAAMEILSGTKAEEVSEAKVEAKDSANTERPAEAQADDEDEDYDLPISYKKDVRELVKKLPKGYEELGKAFVKRAKEVEREKVKNYSELQSKTAFAAKLSKAVEPYLEHWQAKGIVPEIGLSRAAKLDYLVATDPIAAAKFVMQIANLKKIDLDTDELEAINEAKKQVGQQTHLPTQQALSQDDIRRIIQEETGRASQIQTNTQDNLKTIERLVSEKSVDGKDKYPQLKDDDFVNSMNPLVTSLLRDPTNNLSFEQAMLAAYISRGGVIEQGSYQAKANSSRQDSSRLEKLKVASTIRPANSSTNMMSLDDIEVPDSIEETIALAQRLAEGRG